MIRDPCDWAGLGGPFNLHHLIDDKEISSMNKFNAGVILLFLGVALLVCGGFSYTTQDKTSIGPITIEHPEEHRLPYSPIAGVLLPVTGAVLMVTGRATSPRQP